MFFQKKKGVLDLTRYPHRTSKKHEIASQVVEDYRDLTIPTINSPSIPSPVLESQDSNFSFFGAMAESAALSVPAPKLELEKDFAIQLDNFDYKLESFGKRISTLFDRIELLEKKVERFAIRQ